MQKTQTNNLSELLNIFVTPILELFYFLKQKKEEKEETKKGVKMKEEKI